MSAEHMLRAMTAAYNAGDVERLVSFYHEDGVLELYSGGAPLRESPYRGHGALRPWMEGRREDHHHTDMRVVCVSNDTIFVQTEFTDDFIRGSPLEYARVNELMLVEGDRIRQHVAVMHPEDAAVLEKYWQEISAQGT